MTRARKASARRSGLGTPSPLALAPHPDHRQLALDRAPADGEIDDAVHRHQPLELMLDLRRLAIGVPRVTMVISERCFWCLVPTP